jgi:Fe-Mn family superoxide dismutase
MAVPDEPGSRSTMTDRQSLPSAVAPTRRTVLQTLGLTAGLASLGTTGALAATTEQAETKAEYELPPLPYDYDALEPHIDEQIMRLHHDEHHQGYVDGANKALQTLAEMRAQGNFEGIKHLKRDLSYNLSGHILHSIFWQNMSPSGSGKPTGALADAITRDFGSIEAMRQAFSAAAENVADSGWGMLVYDHLADQLLVTQAENHNDLAIQGATPLLVVDVWEHAYYLQYTNNRGKYITNWWNVVNWDDVAARYQAVTECDLLGQTPC